MTERAGTAQKVHILLLILGQRWDHIALILSYFRVFVGLYFGLGPFSVVEFWSLQVVWEKQHRKYQENSISWGGVADVFDVFLCSLFSTFLGACCT